MQSQHYERGGSSSKISDITQSDIIRQSQETGPLDESQAGHVMNALRMYGSIIAFNYRPYLRRAFGMSDMETDSVKAGIIDKVVNAMADPLIIGSINITPHSDNPAYTVEFRATGNHISADVMTTTRMTVDTAPDLKTMELAYPPEKHRGAANQFIIANRVAPDGFAIDPQPQGWVCLGSRQIVEYLAKSSSIDNRMRTEMDDGKSPIEAYLHVRGFDLVQVAMVTLVNDPSLNPTQI